MFHRQLTTAVATLVWFAAATLQAETLYLDPKGRFSITIPTGWNSSADDDLLQLKNGDAFVTVLVADGQNSARDLLIGAIAQVRRRWTDFQTVGSPPGTQLGGQPAAFELELGVNQSGVKSFAAIYAIKVGGLGFVMMQTGRADEFSSLGHQLDSIASSFSLTPRATNSFIPQPSSRPATQTTVYQRSVEARAENYQAPDGSLSCDLPEHWKVRVTSLGSSPLYVLEPMDGSEQSILVTAGPATTDQIRDATKAVVEYTIQTIPGLQLASQSGSSSRTAEIRYTRATVAGQQAWWQELALKEDRLLTVTCGGRADKAQALRDKCLGVFYSVKLTKAPVQEGNDTSQALIGHWSFYQRSDVSRGSVERHLTFSSNGRFDYSSTVYVPGVLPGAVDPTVRESGTYSMHGNSVTAQSDSGKQLTFQVQLVDGGQILMINGEKYLRE